MKLLYLTHNSLTYEFRFLEQSSLIEVTKEDRFHYTISYKDGKWICNCPGSRFHHKCWHITHIFQLLNQPNVKEPWALWAEEGGRKAYVSHQKC